MPAERVALLKPTAVNAILAEARALQHEGRALVSLMRGEPDFRTPPHIAEAASAALNAGRTTYPEQRGERALREAVALKLSRDNNVKYDPATEVLITDGATLGIHTAFMSLLGPGDEVLVPDPIYDAYQSPIRLSGATVCAVPSRRENGRFSITVEDLEAAWTPATRALLLNTPWNPVGTVLRKAELKEIAEFVIQRNLTLISDEIYEMITYDDHRHLSPASLSSELRDRCVMINSLSKTYAMTGWRVGYCAAPASIIQTMVLILQQSSRGPATFIQDAAAAGLTGSQDCVFQMRDIYAQRRQLCLDALSGLNGVRVLPPEGGFFVMVDVGDLARSSDDVRRYLLREHGVIVAHGSAYGTGGEGTLRVSFATGGDTLSRGLELLRQGLRSI